jgi:hypothetical protein
MAYRFNCLLTRRNTVKKAFLFLLFIFLAAASVAHAGDSCRWGMCQAEPSGGVAGSYIPDADDTYDLGSSAFEFRDIYIDGTGYFDQLDVQEIFNSEGDVWINDNLQISGTGSDALFYAEAGDSLGLSANGDTQINFKILSDESEAQVLNGNLGTTGMAFGIYGDSSTPADTDQPAILNFKGNDHLGNETIYAQIYVEADDITDGTEDGTLYLRLMTGGALAAPVAIVGGGSGDDVAVDGGDVTDPDFVSTGDIDFVDTANSISANLNDDVIGTAEMSDADFGDWTCSGGSCTLDADVIAPAEMADADFGDFSCSGGNCTLDAAATGTMTTVEDGDSQVGGSDIVTIDFEGTTFAITEDPDTEINIAIAADGINDTHLDFGSGANQINSDDVPEGSTNFYDDDGVDDDDPEAGDVSWSDLTDQGTHTDGLFCTYASGTGFISCNSSPGAETNSLETTITGIADTEIFVGNGANSGAFVAVSGDATLANTGALTIASDAIEEAMLKAVNSPTDEYCMTYESTTGDFEWQSCGIGAETNNLETTITGIADTEIFVGDGNDSGAFVTVSGDASLANTGALTIASDAIEESMLKAVDAAADEECLTYESTTGDFEWQSCGSVAGAETMMTFVISGGGSAVDAGVTDPVICQRVETDFALSAWYIYSDQDGDIVLDIWKDVWANYPPTNTDSIAGTEKPTLSSADTASDTSLGSMTTDWNTGDVVCVEIESAATLTWAVVDFIGTPD